MSDSVVVAKRPSCDIHKYRLGVEDVPAEFDGKTKDGPWANMCAVCFVKYGVGLGTGRGQRLVVKEEKD